MNTATLDSQFCRHAYLYPEGVFTNVLISGDTVQLKHGDTIRSMEFGKTSFTELRGNPKFKIYLRNNAFSNLGAGNIDWEAEAQTAELVYKGDPTSILGNTPGYKRFNFNQASYFVYDTSKGKNLEVLVEYTQDSGQTSIVSYNFDSPSTQPLYSSSDEGKFLNGTLPLTKQTTFSSANKPTIRFNFFRYRNNLEVRNIYALGRVPILSGIGDSIKFLVQNVGLETQYNRKAYLTISLGDTHRDTIVIDSIVPHQERIFAFPPHAPDSVGIENISIVLENDQFPDNDSSEIQRQVTYNDYSHSDPFQANSGGIGFNGSTGDFVAKFYADSGKYINQVSVDFNSGNNPFRIGIWDANGPGGTPGKPLFLSDTLTSTSGTYILPLLPRIPVGSSFFIGLRQVGTSNLSFSFQFEQPIRPNTFYFAAPAGDTSWVSFSPGFDYKFNIQPRLQVKHDIAPMEILAPTEDQDYTFGSIDSIDVSAQLLNFGIEDEDSVLVRATITDIYTLQVYRDEQYIDLKSGEDTILNFSKYKLGLTGDYVLTVESMLGRDLTPANDRLVRNFSVSKQDDIAVDNLFSPVANSRWEMNRDTILPIVRVVNVGRNRKTNVPVIFQFLQDTTILYSFSKGVTLNGGESTILEYDSFPVKVSGPITARCFANAFRDTFNFNDTVSAVVLGVKSDDLAAHRFLKPAQNSKVGESTTFEPYMEVRNEGSLSQDTAGVRYSIYKSDGTLLYRDSSNMEVFAFSSAQIIFKPFKTPAEFQTLNSELITYLADDQDPNNDTLIGTFRVAAAKDISLDAVLSPVNTVVSTKDTTVFPTLQILNAGASEFDDTVRFFQTILHRGIAIKDSIDVHLILGVDDTARVDLSGVLLDATGTYNLSVYIPGNNQSVFGPNDSLSYSFKHLRMKDAQITNLRFFPPGKDTLEVIKDSVRVAVDLTNLGTVRIYNTDAPVQVYHEFQGLLHSYSLGLDSMNVGESATLFSPFFSSPDSGVITVIANLDYADDQINELETDTVVIPSIIRFQARADSILFPAEGDRIRVQTTFAPRAKVSHVGSAPMGVYAIKFMVTANKAIIYSKTAQYQLDGTDEQVIRFDSSLRYAGYLEALATLTIADENDFFLKDDTVQVNFVFDNKLSVDNMNTIPFISLYPNPTEGEVNIYTEVRSKKIKILDIQGRVITEVQPKRNKTNFTINSWNSGVYLIEITFDSGRSRTFRLIKR